MGAAFGGDRHHGLPGVAGPSLGLAWRQVAWLRFVGRLMVPFLVRVVLRNPLRRAVQFWMQSGLRLPEGLLPSKMRGGLLLQESLLQEGSLLQEWLWAASRSVPPWRLLQQQLRL